MLHEVLLALSGHPSTLFKDSDPTQLASGVHDVNEDFPLISPSEKALLQSIGQLSELHRKLRHHIEQIALQNRSTICRAVATSIQQKHLSRFQGKILEVESKILTKNASLVGAYDIVPLAGVIGEFADWHRRMAWYWNMACFMQPVDTKTKQCTGATLIDKLRAEQQTGFPDIAVVAIELSKVAETAWLRQVASWILYGTLLTFGADDFFIRATQVDDGETTHLSKDKDLLPKFVEGSTASSILFIGKSLQQIRKYGQQIRISSGGPSQTLSEGILASKHIQQLSNLSLPIVSAQLSRSISAIRMSLSRNILKHLLPMETTLELLSCLKQFFLLGRGEFAVALINEADSRMQARRQSMGRLLQQDPVKALQGLSIKDAEFQQILSRTWKALASQDEDAEDDILDFARRHVSLSTLLEQNSRPSSSDSYNGVASNLTSIAFNDLLFPNAVTLGLSIMRPLDLFISPKEVEMYSTINAYLLTIRRGHLRLSDLWRRTPARRDSPLLRGSTNSTEVSQDARERTMKRRVATRKVWATCSAALFLLSETSAYLEGEIIGESWDHFETWVKQPVTNDTEISEMVASPDTSEAIAQQDPETLASGHRTFLSSLTYALLLNDLPYTRGLRSLLGNVDSLIALFSRLLEVQQKADLERDAGGETGYTTAEEQQVSLELDRSRKKVDSDLKSVVNRLRQLDHERIGSARYLNALPAEGGFEPWKGGGVDRLLMKLEFGRMVEDGIDIA